MERKFQEGAGRRWDAEIVSRHVRGKLPISAGRFFKEYPGNRCSVQLCVFFRDPLYRFRLPENPAAPFLVLAFRP